jgi:hypothetical protein
MDIFPWPPDRLECGLYQNPGNLIILGLILIFLFEIMERLVDRHTRVGVLKD